MVKRKRRTRQNSWRIDRQIALEQSISMMYKSGNFTTERVASTYGVSTKTVQRIAKKWGVLRTAAESNKLMAPQKAYWRMRVPEELKVKRKCLSNKLRLEILLASPQCTICGSTRKEGAKLEVDHIDNNPSNNARDNLQVLCSRCNSGKAHLHRFGKTAP